VTLQREIESMRKEIRTDAYLMSIGEWISLYENHEIDIHPEFQRFYRWSKDQKSRLIESILLGIPIPPIFVSQREDGVWDVVDGLQRLSTIYEFAGILRGEDRNVLPPATLEKTEYLPSLQGKKWDDPADPKNSLTANERLLIKRSKIGVSIILRESDELAKFELFQRLNTGGSSLTPQEVRNCVLVMVNAEFYRRLRDLASYEPFQECISLSDRPLVEQYDMELALRFLVFARISEDELAGLGDVGVFITKRMVDLARSEAFDFESYERDFKRVFDLLVRTTGMNSFRKYSDERERFMGGFVLSPYEVVALGLGYDTDSMPDDDEMEDRVRGIWNNETLQTWSGSGITASRRLPRLVPLGRELFRK